MGMFLDESRSFDQVEVGDAWKSPSRTITETDIVNFAGLTGDYNALHVDHKFARSTPFGRPIAHGPVGFVVRRGLGEPKSRHADHCLHAIGRLEVLAPSIHR